MSSPGQRHAAATRHRAALIGRAKSLAVPVANCVQARIAPAHLLRDLARNELEALVIVLAEAADLDTVRQIADTPDDAGPVDQEARAAMLRRGRSLAQGFRDTGRKVPDYVAALEREYWRWRKQEQRRAA